MNTVLRIFTTIILLSSMVMQSSEKSTHKNSICTGDVCIPYTIAPYDKTLDAPFIAELIASQQQALPFKTIPQYLETFLNHTTKTYTDPANEQERAAFDKEHPMFYEPCAAILRIANKPIALVCYSIIKMQKPQVLNMGQIEYLYTPEENEIAISKALIDHALSFMSNNQAHMIMAKLFGTNKNQQKALEETGFTYACTKDTIIVYTKISEEFAQSMKKEAEAPEPDSGPYVIHLTPENAEEMVMNLKGPIVLDLYATWCPPCKKLTPIISALAESKKDMIHFAKFNADDTQKSTFISGLCKDHEIKSIPTLFFIKEGKVLGVHSGYLDEKALAEKITQYFN
jgi:thioredoxin 1